MPRMQYLPPLQKSVPRKAPRQATGNTSSTDGDSDDEIPLLDFMQMAQIKKAQQLHRLKERKRGTQKRTLCSDRTKVRVEEYEDKELEGQIDRSHFAHLNPKKNSKIEVISDTEEEEEQSEPAPEPLRVVQQKRRSKALLSPKEILYEPLPPVMETATLENQPPLVSSYEGTLTTDIDPSSDRVKRVSTAKDILKAMETASLKDRSLTRTLEDCKSLKKKTSFWRSVKNVFKRKESRRSGLVYADKELYI